MVNYTPVGPFVNNGPPALSADNLNELEQGIVDLVSELSAAQVSLAAAITKLNTVQTGATANDTDADLHDLGQATGSLPQNQVTGLVAALASFHADIAGTKM